jgi:hypothetical protein
MRQTPARRLKSFMRCLIMCLADHGKYYAVCRKRPWANRADTGLLVGAAPDSTLDPIQVDALPHDRFYLNTGAFGYTVGYFEVDKAAEVITGRVLASDVGIPCDTR